MAKMMSDTNTQKVERAVLRAARAKFGPGMVAIWEHGHWWVERKATGEQWSVCDGIGPGTMDGFDFEQVTFGEG